MDKIQLAKLCGMKETTAADDYWLQKAYDLQIGLVKDRENIRKEDKKMKELEMPGKKHTAHH